MKKVCVNVNHEMWDYLATIGPPGWVMERALFAVMKGIKRPGTEEHRFIVDLFGNDFENKLECSDTEPYELRPKRPRLEDE